jgi:tetratricopeptide (TPR) repeat protein
VESVGYVIQRAESLMGLLYLLTLYCFIRHSAGGRASVAWGAAAFLSCLLGMGTKEAMVTAPVIVLLYDRTFLAGSFAQAWRQRWRLYLLLGACWVPLGIQMAFGGGRSGTAGFDSGVTPWAYFLTQLKAVVLYLRLSFWPRHLVGDYGRILGGSTLELTASAILVALLAATTIFLLVRRPALGFLGAWFFVILAPTSSVVPISTEIMALHRMYLPLAAVVVSALLLLRLWLGGGRLLWVAVAIAAAGLGFAAMRRDRVYKGPAEFWGDVALKAPWNAGAWNNLGLISAGKGDQDGAIADFRRALAIAPKFSTAHVNLGKALLAAGHPQEALSEFEAALEFLKFDPEIHHQMGKAFALQHQFGKAIEQLGESVNLDGDRADVWFDFGVVMEQAGNTGPAIYFYKRSVELNPSNVEARLDLGNLLAQASRMPEAIVQYEDAALLQPKAADIHNNLGGLLAESGRLAEAKAQFEEALRLQPSYAEARDNLARVNMMMGPGISK